jgi:hypothetical protein
MPASFGTMVAGNGRARQNGDALESCRRVPVGARRGRVLPRKPENQGRQPDRRRSAYLRVAQLFVGAVCCGFSRRTIRLTSDSQRSNAILDENPRKKSRAKRHKASKKARLLTDLHRILGATGRTRPVRSVKQHGHWSGTTSGTRNLS